MSFDIVNYNPKTNKFSWGSNCLPGEPVNCVDCIDRVPQGGDLYLLSITEKYEDGDTEFLAFDPNNRKISLWIFFEDFGVFEELKILGKWNDSVVSKKDYEKMKEYALNTYNNYELTEFEKYLEEN